MGGSPPPPSDATVDAPSNWFRARSSSAAIEIGMNRPLAVVVHTFLAAGLGVGVARPAARSHTGCPPPVGTDCPCGAGGADSASLAASLAASLMLLVRAASTAPSRRAAD